MKSVEQRGIDKHNTRLKDPEINLVLINLAVPAHDELHEPIDAPDRHNRSAHIHDHQHGSQVFRQDARGAGASVEHGGEQTEGPEECGLQRQRGGYHVGAHLPLRVGHGAVRHAPGAVADEDFADGVEADEGGGDTAGVQGGEVGDVVEDAAEDNYLHVFINSKCNCDVIQSRVA